MWPWGLGASSQATSGWAVGGTVVGGWEEGLDGWMVVVRISLADGDGGVGWVVRRTGVPREAPAVLAGALCPWPVSPAVGRRLRKGPGQGGPAPEVGVQSMPILPGPALEYRPAPVLGPSLPTPQLSAGGRT